MLSLEVNTPFAYVKHSSWALHDVNDASGSVIVAIVVIAM